MELRIMTTKVLAVNLLILGSVAGVCSGVGFLVALDIGSIFSFIAAFTVLIAMVLAYAYEAVCLLHTLVFLGLVIGACNSSLYLSTEKGGCSRSREFTGIYAFNMALTMTNGVLCALLILNVCGCSTKQTEKARPMSRPVTKTKQPPQPKIQQKTGPVPADTTVPDTKKKRTRKSKRPSSFYNWPSTPILSPSPGR
ncbi:Hypp3850 [Branchiostoma lanceolatum]|uniref:Hypp3850 protein n=1 Tax=Branchiostoma lanceolatum TaxID=7740 RepID=A0A8K0EYW5_BRALA|nr:Hypp3850 [Branchiostoma lanceolatum]